MKTKSSKNRNFKIFTFLIVAFFTISIHCQTPIGTIFDNVRMQSFTLFNNGVMVQNGNPQSIGQTLRDPSGLMYLMLPSANPHINAFFVNWNNQIIEVNRFTGTNIIGYCQCPPPINPYANLYTPPQFNPHVGVQTQSGFRPLPNAIIDTNNPYGNIMITSEQRAQQCYQQSLDQQGNLVREKFGECMIQNLAGNKELEIYNCVKNSRTPQEQTMCLFGALGGTKEKQIAQKIQECYNLYGSDYSRYPLCMAGTATDGSVAQVLACMEQQSRTGQVSIMGTAICYGTNNLNLNPETQIIIECAMASGGEPYTFAGCAGGQLLSRELDKCFTYGVGGDNGCFGNNNEIIKGLRAIGTTMQAQFGPNNDIVKLWNNSVNDIVNGPGPNNDAVKTIRNIGNEMEKAPRNIGNAIERVVPKIKLW